MQVLLEAGADPTLSDHGAPQPMHRAASSGDAGNAQLNTMSHQVLRRDACLDVCGNPEAYPIVAGSMPCMKLLLENGADVNAASKVGTPLLWALSANAEACASFLLDHGADPCATDPSNISPVLLAVATGLSNTIPHAAQRSIAAQPE